MKNIKITTFQGAHNYGAFLQAYALQCFLKKNNYNVKIVNYKKKYISEEHPIFFVKSNIKWSINSFIDYIIYGRKMEKRYYSFKKMINNTLPLTKVVKNRKQFENVLTDNDILITGSDQIWNPKLTQGVDEIYFLNTTKKIKRIAYAASMGSYENVIGYENEFYDYLEKFDKISLREKSSCEKIKEKINSIEVECVVDPTLLLNGNEWDEEVNQYNYLKNNYNFDYIFVYQVSPSEEFVKTVNYLSDKLDLKIVYFDKEDLYRCDGLSAYTSNPFEFVWLLKNAKYVVTSSFHGTVFSIIYKKQFLIVTPNKNGNRVTDLLNSIGLTSRAFLKCEDVSDEILNEKIDYNDVAKKINTYIKFSKKWLIDAIEVNND